MKLNLGCGQNPMEGWTNLDWIAGPGVNLVLDLEDAHHEGWEELRQAPVDEVFASHLIEHIRDPLAVMENLWLMANDGAKATFLCPYGSSDDADEDPTHVRRMFINSWVYFSQPTYWRGNTNYQGDWRVKGVQLRITPETWHQSLSASAKSLDHLFTRVSRERNVVQEMCAVLECVKPARPREKALMDKVQVSLEMITPNEGYRLLGAVMVG